MLPSFQQFDAATSSAHASPLQATGVQLAPLHSSDNDRLPNLPHLAPTISSSHHLPFPCSVAPAFTSTDVMFNLPPHLLLRLSENLTSNHPTSAWRYASFAPAQLRKAILASFRHSMTIGDSSYHNVPNWLQIFGHALVKLSMEDMCYRALPTLPATQSRNPDMPLLPRLRVASLRATPSHIRFILECAPRCESLSLLLRVGRPCDSESPDWNLIITACLSLPLTELTLVCPSSGHHCPIITLTTPLRRDLARACMRIRKLTLACLCDRVPENDMMQFCKEVGSSGALETLVVHTEIASNEASSLKNIPNIELHVSMPIRVSVKIGNPVSTVVQWRRASLGTVNLLTAFPRLNVLRIAMHDEAEKGLLPSVLRNLEILDMSWGYDDYYDEYDSEDEDADDRYGDGDVTVGMGATDYYEPAPRTLVDLVKRAPNLKELCLNRAFVSTATLQAIMKTMGSNLVRIGLHMDKQGECPATRMLGILFCALQHCPNLEFLDILGSCDFRYSSALQKHRCRVTLAFLKRRQPRFLSFRIVQFINGIEDSDGEGTYENMTDIESVDSQ